MIESISPMTISESMSPESLSLKNHREAALDRATAGIRLCQRSALREVVAIGRWLAQVKDQRLYLARWHTFYEYLDREALVARKNAQVWISWSIKWDQLHDQLPMDYPMPEAGGQLDALQEAPEKRRGEAWVISRRRSEESGHLITKRMLAAVIHEHYASNGRSGLSNNEDKNSLEPPKIKSIAEARVRIAELCGDTLLRRIDRDFYHVPERDLIYWANGTDEQVRFTGRAIEHLFWDVTRARIAWAEKVDIDWSVRQLIAKMICQGQPMTIRANGCKITIAKE